MKSKEDALKFLEPYCYDFEPEHAYPFQNVYDNIVNGRITDYSKENIMNEVNIEKKKLGWN